MFHDNSIVYEAESSTEKADEKKIVQEIFLIVNPKNACDWILIKRKTDLVGP